MQQTAKKTFLSVFFRLLESNLQDLAPIFNGRSRMDTSRSVLQCLQISSQTHVKPKYFKQSIENHLECQLKHAEAETNSNSDCPYFLPNGSTKALQEHFELAEENSNLGAFDEFCETVWSLCVALWGEQEELEDVRDDNHAAIMMRRELFSDWLESVVTAKKLSKQDQSPGSLKPILNLLTCHKVEEACELAFKTNNMNLALLLSQTSSSKVVRALLNAQLESWKSTGADQFIDIDYMKSVMLAAGVAKFESSPNEVNVNVYENMDWLKAIAINVWYLCSPTASITDALIRYDDASQSAEAASPLPSYVNEYRIDTARQIYDVRYHLLQLFSKRSHPLETLLNPATHSVDLLDFRLSWLLLQVLRGLGYNHCSEMSEAHLHSSFAAQLEANGLWQWAIFVLLHIRNQSQREIAVQTLLYRYIDLSTDEEYLKKENFIINNLRVPEKWIYWAKAVRAGAQNNYHAQADYLLKAKQWANAHEIIMNHIVPDAIINGKHSHQTNHHTSNRPRFICICSPFAGNTRYIKDLLDRFEDPRQVPNWLNQGSIILDYLDITAKVTISTSYSINLFYINIVRIATVRNAEIDSPARYGNSLGRTETRIIRIMFTHRIVSMSNIEASPLPK